MLKLFKKKKSDDFPSKMILLIDSVINGRLQIHFRYELLIKKLSRSEKSIDTKLRISRYIMHRILRESDRIFIKAQIKANKLCPCSRSDNKNVVIPEYENDLKTYH